MTEALPASILLGSASPARRALLEQAGFRVNVFITHTDERCDAGVPAEQIVRTLARRKMANLRSNPAYQRSPAVSQPVITADTLIFSENHILGKPEDRAHARKMLQNLSGRSHEVFTGYSLYLPQQDMCVSGIDSAEITFFSLSAEEIDAYLDRGEWQGAAGSYRIQGAGLSLISSINGNYFTIVGLPIQKIFGILRTLDS